jgi:hypothetical protein
MKIRLETREGELASERTVPEFKLLPEVMVWGNRTFTLHYEASFTAGSPVYREACVFYINEYERPWIAQDRSG